MSTSENMITNVITARPEQSVADAISLLHKHSVRTLPVVDETNRVVGLFSFSFLLKDLLPISVTLDDDITHGRHMEISLDHIHGQEPWLAKRLKAFMGKKVEDVMLKDIVSVHPDTPLRETVRLIVKYGSPITVVEESSKKLVGLISSQSAVASIMDIMHSLEKGEHVAE